HLMDHERPLKKRGRKDAAAMGDLLSGKKRLPTVIYSSTAERARETAGIVAEKSGYLGEVRHDRKLYLAEPDTLVAYLHQIPDEIDCILLVGHNPGLEALVQVLSGKIVALPTAAIAHLQLPVEKWKDISLNTRGELAHLWVPKDK
ncbi:MAG: histidine phosphatase family protein, partial [Anaerolineaceae bacterium]|nr:histidine phosphatase family protein [Anaerolineaceae bacterium]